MLQNVYENCVWKAKNSATILLLWRKECVKRHKHQLTVHCDAFYIKSLVWRETKCNWFSSWSQLRFQCVFASLTRAAIGLHKMPILPKKIILDEAHFGGYVKKQICRILDTKTADIHWKADPPKRVTVWCRSWSRGIMRPYIFENEKGVAVTDNRNHVWSRLIYTLL